MSLHSSSKRERVIVALKSIPSYSESSSRLDVADDDSVVDPLTMKVHGIEGVRVCDASAMRYVTNGNIYAPVMMMAEKAADLILGNTPLAPEHAPYYRATTG